jgi:hypothetical protein
MRAYAVGACLKSMQCLPLGRMLMGFEGGHLFDFQRN